MRLHPTIIKKSSDNTVQRMTQLTGINTFYVAYIAFHSPTLRKGCHRSCISPENRFSCRILEPFAIIFFFFFKLSTHILELCGLFHHMYSKCYHVLNYNSVQYDLSHCICIQNRKKKMQLKFIIITIKETYQNNKIAKLKI